MKKCIDYILCRLGVHRWVVIDSVQPLDIVNMVITGKRSDDGQYHSDVDYSETFERPVVNRVCYVCNRQDNQIKQAVDRYVHNENERRRRLRHVHNQIQKVTT